MEEVKQWGGGGGEKKMERTAENTCRDIGHGGDIGRE